MWCISSNGILLNQVVAASDLFSDKKTKLFVFFLRKLYFLSQLEYHSNCENIYLFLDVFVLVSFRCFGFQYMPLKSRCNLGDPKISVHFWRAQMSVFGQKLTCDQAFQKMGRLIAQSKICWTVTYGKYTARHAYGGSFDNFYFSKPLATTTANSTDCN